MENKEQILGKFQKEEKKSRKRMLLYSSFPIIITVILIFGSYFTVDNAQNQVAVLTNEMQTLETTVIELNKEIITKTDKLVEMERAYKLAINYKDKRFHFDFKRDKELFSRYPKQTKMITEMRRMIDANEIKWHLGGNSPEQGFDSPSFATYIINKFSKTAVPANERYKLKEILPTTTKPKVGDVVFYEQGYSMIYFEYRNRPFVVGMTPIGLASLTLEFGPKILGFASIEY
ncbi:MAG: hypothetical protein KAH68_02365 [Draconibacterium sp.]|nr:hypothetical protein [Draconibacterium sp.]